ncbi:hypothetical protein Q8791_00415 [Nocardiopsis sp. CT-R113]|uniref:Uncharacterized protein n=1 Tax=Nocardiopsis codii TaxID=3065942 RepID=A0ABU7K1G6_9ACTN|nr:hypothetical protein [Nocardiopsis sp. CT-R113]MEE2035684.1 hypothetical protein [Nocardiopsis sp. CT-R113]
MIGLSLVAVTAVAGSLLAFGSGSPLAQEVPAPAATAEGPALVDFTDEHVSLRYPEGWTVAGPAPLPEPGESEVLSFQRITAPGGEHTFCFNAHETDGGLTSMEQQEEWEAGLLDGAGISDVRRIALKQDTSAPLGWDTSRLELTYTNTRWDEPDRWVVWQYTVIEGRGYFVQADIPAADLPAYEDLVDAVLDTFEPVL